MGFLSQWTHLPQEPIATRTHSCLLHFSLGVCSQEGHLEEGGGAWVHYADTWLSAAVQALPISLILLQSGENPLWLYKIWLLTPGRGITSTHYLWLSQCLHLSWMFGMNEGRWGSSAVVKATCLGSKPDKNQPNLWLRNTGLTPSGNSSL